MVRLRISLGESVAVIVALVLAVEIGLYALVWFSDAVVAGNYLPSLLSAKITFISLLTATITFLHRLFLDEVRSASKPEPTAADPGGGTGSTGPSRLAPIVIEYRFYYLLIFSAILTTFIAILADVEIATGGTSRAWQVLSISSASSGLALLLVFLSYFIVRTLRGMGALLRTGSIT